ncbi:hypothetical protein CWE15_00635 [Aliidiomarina taiwanensis]|uniref:Uncharacterized protein n=1 Tax=Aliidiomarina taiwanensis TaxID=946228 RepID=A0A432X8L9_9GAMM|nr:hypothetical protein [Aliidiomarina taiwanensis]RUO43743.1 hypothetical protein CWE15_00635 [Aliidiomarina taiwanensis]
MKLYYYATTLFALIIGLGIFILISIPALLLTYFIVWLCSFAFSYSFSSWSTHLVIWAISAVWTIGALNTKEGGELAATVITGKR